MLLRSLLKGYGQVSAHVLPWRRSGLPRMSSSALWLFCKCTSNISRHKCGSTWAHEWRKIRAHMIGLAVTTVIGGLAELLPSKLASLWMDELTLSFSCFTAGKRQREKKHFGSIKCLINTGSAASWYSVRGCMMLPSCYHHLTSSGPRRTRHKTSKWGRNNGRRYANKKSISNTFQERLKRNKSVTDAQETSTKLTGYMRKNK